MNVPDVKPCEKDFKSTYPQEALLDITCIYLPFLWVNARTPR
jgi:hypothetical protein